ncbi:MAG: peptide chain release factor 1 [Alphaproteobacteria bacterium CG_4_10_14_0_8_um_filter_53_9]|nr:MAG: peptide chain release factor 1 [Alphaproteobacteria bacterium CG_4_10_14_0_8_um_filter_53_9]
MSLNMQSQIQKIITRRAEVAEKLMDPTVTSDIASYTKLSKEYKALEEVCTQGETYLALAKSKSEAAEILADKTADPDFKSMAQDEYDNALKELPKLEENLKVLLLPKDEDDERNAILEIRAGTGGDEAALFAADLFKMYNAYAATQDWTVEIQDVSESDVGGYKEIIAKITGYNVFGKLKFESGVHRVQRVPATETQGRVHTSAATVAVLPEAEEVDVHIEEKDLRIDVFRSSGPGGQSVNTTDSAVRITHLPTNIVVQCQDEKSQLKNKAKALNILRSRILAAEREKVDAVRALSRKSMVGSGDRSEKIRTYNYPQSRVTDHRIETSWHSLNSIMQGIGLEDVIDTLQREDQAARLAALAE